VILAAKGQSYGERKRGLPIGMKVKEEDLAAVVTLTVPTVNLRQLATNPHGGRKGLPTGVI
jgi:hypothetical protein